MPSSNVQSLFLENVELWQPRKVNEWFEVILPEELAKQLADLGWNVQHSEHFSGVPTAYLKVSINKHTDLCVKIPEGIRANVTIKPYEWEVKGYRGIKAYFQSIEILPKETH